MEFIKPFIYFLLINFAVLGLGVLLMRNGPQSPWYLELTKAPWTPAGWVFGAAWGSIMLLFALYLAFAYGKVNHDKLLLLFVLQFVLNVAWNYVFFNQHSILGGLIIIVLLSFLMLYFFLLYLKPLSYKSLFILPYIIWLFIATSLNLYIYIHNK